MSLSDQTLSIADFRRLGAFELYHEAEVKAFVAGKDIAADAAAQEEISDDLCFRLGDMFASPTKFPRLLWLARRPGLLPEQLVRQFAFEVASECLNRLSKEGVLSDIRLTAGIAAVKAHLKGERHVRSLEPLHRAAVQARLDHQEHACERASDGCHAVEAALDPSAYEAAAETAYAFLGLFDDTESEAWIRTCLRELIQNAD
ncbi:hypothetical protein [Microbulbifer sp. TYP-18]|uniref:hypothetical protein n=1 Tax=Microbulbifer sp. TYP-18 TaxID=3230024 RepID=UPI0034C5DB61